MQADHRTPAAPVRATSVEFGLRLFALKVLAVACAAVLAAAIAHFLIDLAGDFILPHDPYDDIAHGSRPLASGIAFLLGLVLATRLLLLACGTNEARHVALRRAVLALVGREPWIFGFCVACATLAATAMMELADTVAAGDPDWDVASLFGGSVPLGCGISLAVALIVALCFRRLLAFVASSDVAIARLLDSWLRGVGKPAQPSRTRRVTLASPGGSFAGSGAARRAGKRAPPLLLA